MGRPTDEVKSHTVKCRIGDSLYEKIQGNVSEIMREALESYVAQKDNSVAQNVGQNNSNVAQKESNVTQNRIEELENEIINLRFQLSDDPNRKELENMAEQTCGIERFYESVLEKVERGEMDFDIDGFNMTDQDVMLALQNSEVRVHLEGLRDICVDRDKDISAVMVKSMINVFKQAKEELYRVG